MKGLTRVNRQLVIGIAQRYYQKKLTEYSPSNYDFIFVINGQTLSPQILSQWRKEFPTAKFILYIWDSIKNRPTIQKNFDFFDKCFSFDRKDSDFWGLAFLPLFFSKGFESAASKVNACYDLSFIGTAHSNRYSIVSNISQMLSERVRFYKYLYLQAKWVYRYYKITNSTFKLSNVNEFMFNPLPKEIVQKIFLASTSILDIEHPLQTGLTIRTLETLGAKKKLITTNRNITDYDFYSPQNILILDRNKTHIPEDFYISHIRK